MTFSRSPLPPSKGFERLDTRRLEALSALFAGDFLAEVEIDRSPQFEGWLISQRRRFRSFRIGLLERLAAAFRRNPTRCCGSSKEWIELAPFDQRAH